MIIYITIGDLCIRKIFVCFLSLFEREKERKNEEGNEVFLISSVCLVRRRILKLIEYTNNKNNNIKKMIKKI